MDIHEELQDIENDKFSKIFSHLYGTDEKDLEYQKRRYLGAVKRFAELFPKRRDVRIFSASGRTEIGGNHTDHQHGCVLAAAVNLDIIGVAAFHEDGVIRVKSEGYDAFSVDLNSDRAIIRAAHFFGENRRASDEAAALRNGDINGFLDLVRQSGSSSATLLQNHFSCANPENQSISLAIMLSQHFLGDKGAVRVHGGGFAGTVQAFVPVEIADDYIAEMNRIFGEKSCVKIRIRPVGGVEIMKE